MNAGCAGASDVKACCCAAPRRRRGVASLRLSWQMDLATGSIQSFLQCICEDRSARMKTRSCMLSVFS